MEPSDIANRCAFYADEKKAKDIVIMELAGLTDIADYFVIASGTSERHVKTVSEGVEKGMKDAGIRPFSVEGYKESRWVVMDYHNVVIHIFIEPLRELYDIENLWVEAKRHRMEREKLLT